MINLLRFILVLILIQLSSIAHAQHKIQVSGSYNSFALKDLRYAQETFAKSLPFDAQITSQFPEYWGGKVSYYYGINSFLELGVTGFITSTGGRISYADYSGEFYADQLLRLYSFGFNFIYLIEKIGKAKLKLGSNFLVDFTNYKYESRLALYPDYNDFESEEFKSLQLSIWPFLLVDIPVTRRLSLTPSLGAQIRIKDGQLKSSSGQIIGEGPNWSGLRIELGLKYTIARNKN